MTGIITFFAKSKTHKVILAFIIPIITLLSFLGSGVKVFASSYSDLIDANVSKLSTDNLSFDGDNIRSSIRATGVLFEDNYYYDLEHSNLDVYSLKKKYNSGNFWVIYNGTVTVRRAVVGLPSVGTYCFGRGYQYMVLSHNLSHGIISVDSLNAGISINGEAIAYIFGSGNTVDGGVPIAWTGTFETDNNSLGRVSLSVEANISIRVPYAIDSSEDDGGINQALSINPTVSVTLTDNIGSWTIYYCDYNLRDQIQGLDTKLYNLWISQNLIYDQLIWNGNNNFADNLKDQLVSDSAQAHSDAVVAHNDSEDIKGFMQYDTSGSSDNLDLKNQDFVTANGLADTAIDLAVHDYSDSLNTVEDYNYKNFFTSQRNALSFWRTVTGYILDSSNLGFVASGVIIITLITVFSFLLRL